MFSYGAHMEEWDSYKVIELVATGSEKVRALESLIVFRGWTLVMPLNYSWFFFKSLMLILTPWYDTTYIMNKYLLNAFGMGNKFCWQKIHLVKIDSKIEESGYIFVVILLCDDLDFQL